MGLFGNDSFSRTPAQKVADAILRSARNQANRIAQEYAINYDRLWNTVGVDPADVFAELAGNSGPLFSVTNQTMVLAGKADELKDIPAQYTYAVNTDGSITLTYQQLSSSSSSTSEPPPAESSSGSDPLPTSSSSSGARN